MSEEEQGGKSETWTPDGARASSEGSRRRRVSSKKRRAARKPAKRGAGKARKGDLDEAAPATTAGAAELNERRRRFVEFYMSDPTNAALAARKAGFKGTDEALAVTASRLLKNANVRAAMAARASEDPQVATRQKRQRFWTEVMLGEPFVSDVSVDEKGRRSTVTSYPSMRDRLRASQLLGMTHGDFIERHEHTFSSDDLREALERARSKKAGGTPPAAPSSP